MAYQRDRLAKVGREGFSFIDEHFGHHCGKSRWTPSYQVSPVKEVVVVSKKYEATRYCYEPFKYSRVSNITESNIPRSREVQYHGAYYERPHFHVPTLKQSVITSDEAAKKYGGVVIVDYNI
ncbi:hypothetical protein ACFE04_006307 [Oxalis oulophora]